MTRHITTKFGLPVLPTNFASFCVCTKPFAFLDSSNKMSGSKVQYKSKRLVSSSEGSDDESEKKQPKKAKKESKSKEVQKLFQLGNKRQVSVREFKGKIMVDIREYYEDDGELKPGRKGISLKVDQWERLKEHMETIDEAIQSM